MVKLSGLFKVTHVKMQMSDRRTGRSAPPAIRSNGRKRFETNGIDGRYQFSIFHDPFGARPVGVDCNVEPIGVLSCRDGHPHRIEFARDADDV